MSPSQHPYAFLAVYGAVAVAFPFLLLSVTWIWMRLFQPPQPNPLKNSTYECGLPASGEARVQFKAHYYLYALLFLIFDAELLFLLPFAVTMSGPNFPTGAFIAMLVFILLLAEGLVWAWHRRYLEWK